MKQNYTFEKDLRIWKKTASPSLFYSDGDEIENYLLSVLRKAKDVSSLSPEIVTAIKDWPSEYHFSPVRHNLLRPFNFGSSHRILELGCGCGAITRYLGETGAKVIAVEGSQRRAVIAAERCRDLPNVSIYCDNVAEFEIQEKFDVVTLIGVLEYAGLFIPADDPVGVCLRIAGSFIEEDGVLIIAIENQLGLKYFNGSREDHLGISYFGIQDLYDTDTPITFGKRELMYRLKAAGFDSMIFFYPFPDYKLPNIIINDNVSKHIEFRVADLLFRTVSRDYSGNTRRVFNENMAWQPIARNGLLPELANSFLLIARQSNSINIQPNWLARLYTTERLPNFATETVLQSDGDTIIVEKRTLFHQTPDKYNLINGFHLYHQPSHRTSYVSGRLYVVELHSILARGGNITDLANWARPWIELLEAEVTQGPDGRMLPGIWLDGVPFNFIRDISGNLVLIDEEWQTEEPIPFGWVLSRGFIYTLMSCPASSGFLCLSFKEVINRVLILLGHKPYTDTEFRTTGVLEDALQKTINGQPPEISFAQLIERPINLCGVPFTISEENTNLHREISLLHGEIDRVKSTISWQITKPFRLLAFLFRWLLKRCRRKNQA
ncbi:class I SAM-dependent methyltransferase [Desulfobacterium sp. N47]|uniref:Methyltransferase type 12 domain-containing protein n=1 Tax=uncultured Desulfobacterium sp. TaxID=201089 RepID=E1YA61_9BACT|nr:hypothetical protein N47_H22770 [uncultured Desulfobacterium sp.]